MLGFKPKTFAYILYVMPNEEAYYEIFSIPKKDGSKRIINAPNDKLKLLQRRLANYLYDCYEEIMKSRRGSTRLAHGFNRKLSIITNSKKHCKKRYVFNIDLKDFFPSINFGRVRGFFINDLNFKLNQDIATVIAKIACFNNELPQGSPVSPIISNLIGNILDMRILKLAKEAKCYYTRYADDLTFSTNNKLFPVSIALEKDNHWIVGEELKNEIEKSGFKINEKKLTMQYKNSRQTCVGLVINEKVNVKREYYRETRAMCNNLFKKGVFYIGDKDNSNSILQLEGLLNFIYSVKRKHNKQKMEKRYGNPDAISKLYRRFLFFKLVINIDKPIIITEGKSDIVYLQCALKKLKKDYPDLIEMKDDKYCFKIKLFKLSKLFRDVFAIAEGTSGIKKLMDFYKENIDKFSSQRLNIPIIFIIDNDDGAREIKKLLSINNDELEELYKCFHKQVYVLFVDKKRDTEIEDLFEKDVLSTRIDGKSFEPNNEKMDNKKNYGKQIFAKKVILPNYEKIKFDKFKPIFNNVAKIIAECKK
jgi:retron-type reverse transcriptase